jgi:hypothetical protein
LRPQKKWLWAKELRSRAIYAFTFGTSRKAGNARNHDINHHGFRSCLQEAQRVRLYGRRGNDLTHPFPLIVEKLARLRSRSCIIDEKPSPAMTPARLTMKAYSCTPSPNRAKWRRPEA